MDRTGKTLSSWATDWREGRLLRTFVLKQGGWKQKEIADALGVTKGAVSQWMKRARQEGVEGLKHKPPPGVRPRLSADQRARVPELLAQGALAHGFRGDVWTCARVAEVIRKEFGVDYHLAHVSRLVRALGLSLQKPTRRANQRDEEAIKRWKQRALAQAQKGALKEGRTIVFVDQSGFYLLPAVVRTYAPVGQTPVLGEELSRDHLSAMSGITLEGKLLMMEQERAFSRDRTWSDFLGTLYARFQASCW